MKKKYMSGTCLVTALMLLICGFAWSQIDSGRGGVKAESDIDHLKDSSQEPSPLWQRLESMSIEDKENASIQFEFFNELSPEEIQEIGRIENLWNSGNFSAAIEGLRSLEDSGNMHLALGVSWKEPKPTMLTSGGPDTRIDVDGALTETTLDFDHVMERLFAVIRRDGTTNPRWTVNFSVDSGLSWKETYEFNNLYKIVAMDAAVVGDFLYAGIATRPLMGTFTRAWIGRFYKENGNRDLTYPYKLVFDKEIIVKEVALATNVDSGNSRIYYFAILEDNSLVYFWSDETGETWSEISTGITDADFGLDATCNEGGVDNFVMVSYIDTSGRVKVALRSSTWTVVDLDDAVDGTGISAYYDRIMVVYTYYPASGKGIKYKISYNGGADWQYGYVASPTSGEYYHKPDVAGRRGGGFCVVYQEDTGLHDPCWYRHRDYDVPNWTDPVTFNELDVHTGSDMTIEWIPPLSGEESFAYGIIWKHSSLGYGYFDRTDGFFGSLTADTYTLHAGVGGTVYLYVDAGPENYLRPFLILGSTTGTHWGIELPGGLVTLPLYWDWFTDLILASLGPPFFNSFLGILDITGKRTAHLYSPPLPPEAVGMNMYYAFCLGNPFDFGSNPIAIKIVN
ncbi:MAG: hypothetical protein ACYTG7_21790 [Planctomycetota bacterium]|jgi:hypothetical protein